MNRDTARRTSKNAVMLLTGTMTRMVASFAFVLYCAANLGVEGFGKYSIAIHYFELFLSLVATAVGILLTRDIARWPKHLPELLTSAIALTTLLCLGAPLCMFLLAFVSNYSSDTNSAILIASLAVIPAAICVLLEAVFVARERAEFVTLGTAIESTLKIALSFAVLWMGYGINSLIFVVLVTRLILIASYWIGLQRLGEFQVRFSLTRTVRFAQRWRVFAAENWMATINSSLDILLLSWISGEVATGLYSAAFKLVRLGAVVAKSYTTAVFPVMSRLAGQSCAALEQLYYHTIRVMSVLAFAAIAGVAILPSRFIEMLYPGEYADAAPVLQVLILVLWLEFLNPFLSHVLFAQGKQHRSMHVAAISLAVNAITTFLLTHQFGAVGAAIGTVIGGFIATCCYLRFTSSSRGIAQTVGETLRVFLAAAALGGCIFFMRDYHLAAIILVCLGVYPVLLFLTGAMRLQDIRYFQTTFLSRTMDNPTRIAVVGCGAIAELYHLPALKANPRTASSIVLVEPNETRRKQLAEKFEIQRTVGDYTELEGKVDAAIVATPPALHHPISKWLLERGIHVLSEKPLTESMEEAEELVQIAESNNTLLAVNQTRRFFPSYQKLRELIADGTLGDVLQITYHDGIEFDWPAASAHHFSVDAKGSWSDTGVHLLDSVCFWLSDTPELVESKNDSFGGPEAMATVRLRHRKADIEIKVSRLGRLKNGFMIEGTKGRIEAGAEDFSKLIVEFHGGRKQKIRCGKANLEYTDFAEPMLVNFLDAIDGKAEPLAAGKDVLGTIRLLEEAYLLAHPYPMSWNANATREQPVVVNSTPRVLVTGASGFLGGRVVEKLLLSGRMSPVATIRSWTRASRIARHPVDIRLCDITDPAQVLAATEGVDAIIHCAKTDDRESIVGGTRNLLDAAKQHGISKFVFLSSAEVYGPDVSGNILESISIAPTGRLYGDAKLEAERVCHDYVSQGVGASILRPSLIYGPFSSSWSMNLAKRLQSGNWGLFEGDGDGVANLIYVDDLIEAMLTCVEKNAARGEVFNVNGPDRVTWNQYFRDFNEALELPPLQTISQGKSRLRTNVMGVVDRVSDMILGRYEDKIMEIYLRGGLACKIMKRIKGELDSTPTSDELGDLYQRKAVYDDAKLRDLVGYEPKYDLALGLKLTIDWLRLHELAPASTHAEAASSTSDSGEKLEAMLS